MKWLFACLLALSAATVSAQDIDPICRAAVERMNAAFLQELESMVAERMPDHRGEIIPEDENAAIIEKRARDMTADNRAGCAMILALPYSSVQAMARATIKHVQR